MSDTLDRLNIVRKLGQEHFHAGEMPLDFDLLSFWQWCSSDLVDNTMRGVLAEYIVARDLGVENSIRIGWDAYDLKTKEGVKVEVKSAAYLQSWKQKNLSAISFDVRPTLAYDGNTNEYETERKRQADVYVFALLKHQQKSTLDPLDVMQWEFYILSAAMLDEKIQTQKRISLSTLMRLEPIKADFGQITVTIKKIFPHPK
ncbi:MAG: hypothetical protein ACR2LC_09805 [Pyrinomonadaceae bacterium]